MIPHKQQPTLLHLQIQLPAASAAHHQCPLYDSCESGPCTLGVVDRDPTIRQLLANPPEGYGVTEANQSGRQNPNITTLNPKPQEL